jgi:Thiamine pyrophosphate enzyme, C-terminal TPP binding domain
MRASLSGTLATMGSGVPYALAAKLAHPDRAVIPTEAPESDRTVRPTESERHAPR